MITKELENLKGKKIAILGFGLENEALVHFLIKRKIDCEIFILNKTEISNEKLEKVRKSNIKVKIGDKYNLHLENFDIIFRIAGYPLFEKNIKKALLHKTKITSPTKLFFELCPSKNIIGITGTKGKGTTSSLIVSILKNAGKIVYFGGNIGIPMFSFFEKIKSGDFIILELSSFQLEDMDVSPHVAVITNFSKDHLKSADPNNPNHHKSMREYWQAKANIFRFQKKGDYLIINKKIASRVDEIKSKIITFSKSQLDSQLVGEHNKENVDASVSVANIYKINEKVIKKSIKKFTGLDYRIQFICRQGNVSYYNDSFATTPEAAITAMKSFNEPIILLAGGADKGSSFTAMAREIKKRVKFLVLFQGEGSQKLKKALIDNGYSEDNVSIIRDMSAAMKIVKAKVVSGDVVLLSAGCASFGSFKNYKQRGMLFTEEVMKINN